MDELFTPGSRVSYTHRGVIGVVLKQLFEYSDKRPYCIVEWDIEEFDPHERAVYNDNLTLIGFLTKEELLTHRIAQVRALSEEISIE